ncbi:MAG: 2-amino-4-hydroxy-6-hydroxymethyldihydropteridine diphosphokinase [Aeromonadales bacterium]|mgnify:CR=1 FL=1|nr:2-amino-4-hydroxy-6-hydroxymethyldihydropteridine diphosphokinase [Aeromonadales bacterium]
MKNVLLSLGSNMGVSTDIINSACEDIKNHPSVSSYVKSSLYLTKPVGYLDQDDFINVALAIETALEPHELLKLCNELEQKYKRVRLFKDGPRTLDVDIIAYNDLRIEDKNLIIPHARMHERAFVLAPLKEIVPSFVICSFNKTISELYEELPTKEKQGAKVLNG